MHVLVVEDDSRMRKAMRLLLSQFGMNSVAEAGDGQEALAVQHSRPADLILTDMCMPRMDGTEMVRRLRAEGDRTPVILITGQTDPGDLVAAVKAGVDNYIPKPINAEMLLEKIQQTMGIGRAAAAPLA